VPRFYGAFDKLDLKLYQPHLRMFLKDEYPPSAILLEYIPDMQQLHWTNYTKERMGNFVNGLEQIHHAWVEHSDVHPRNMMVVDGDPERAIWIDFDRAQTFDGDDATEDQKEWMAFEKALVAEMTDFMVRIRVTLHAERLQLLTVGSIP
jgi:tRNA A-37 threonylcarbamoyl transferase component Bud32